MQRFVPRSERSETLIWLPRLVVLHGKISPQNRVRRL